MCPGRKEERSRRAPPLDITVPKVGGDPRGVQILKLLPCDSSPTISICSPHGTGGLPIRTGFVLYCGRFHRPDSDERPRSHLVDPMPLTAHLISLILLAPFSTILAVQVGSGLYQSLAELTVIISLTAISFGMIWEGDLTDRTMKGGFLCFAGMLALHQAILWHRGEAGPLSASILEASFKFGFPALLVLWAGFVSQNRSPGQYVYNLIFVSSLALVMGQVALNCVAGRGNGILGGCLAAFLQGAAVGSAFSYITLDFRSSNHSGGYGS